MGLYTLFVILIVIAAILMIGIVLIQESKGGGLASNFSSSNQIMGVRKTYRFYRKSDMGTCYRYGCYQRCVRIRGSDSRYRCQRNRERCYKQQLDKPEHSA